MLRERKKGMEWEGRNGKERNRNERKGKETNGKERKGKEMAKLVPPISSPWCPQITLRG